MGPSDGLFLLKAMAVQCLDALSQSLWCIVLESPVRSGYWAPTGSNRDRDQLVSAGKPKKTGPD